MATRNAVILINLTVALILIAYGVDDLTHQHAWAEIVMGLGCGVWAYVYARINPRDGWARGIR